MATVAIALWQPTQGIVEAKDSAGELKLEYSDGREATVGVEDVNVVLRTVGVRVSIVPPLKAAAPLLEASHTRAITEDEAAELL